MPIRDDEWGRSRPSWLVSSWARGSAALALLAALPAACGDDAEVLQAGEPVQLGEAGRPPESPPNMPGGAGSSAAPDGVDPETGGSAEPPDGASAVESRDVLALFVDDMLVTSCGGCHSDGANGSGFAGGLGIAALVERGLIVPGSSASSPLLQRILDGSMPARSNELAEFFPTVGELDVLADFIDQLSTEPATCEPLPFVGPDAAYAAMLADVQGRPAEDRPYLRYLGLADASNAQHCGPALDQQRHALFKLVNSLSLADALRLPTAIDAAALLYRVDIRDYGWARPIDLADDGSVDADDGWAASLPSAGPHAVALIGPEASALASEIGTPVPFLPVSAFVRAASTGDVYRALLGMRANLYDTEIDLGLDPEQAFRALELRRAAFFGALTGGDVMVSRISLDALGERAYWWRDVDDVAHATTIIDEPMDLYRGRWTQTIWDLPNGLHAYSMDLSDGTPVAHVPHRIDSGSRLQDVHAVACMGCHAGGLRPVEDIVRDFMAENARQIGVELSEIQAIYPTAAEMDQIVVNDNARYAAALAELGLTPGSPDPVSRVYIDLERPVDLARAAAELGVPASTLGANLAALPPALAPLANASATIERAAFDAAFASALCVLHASSRNHPASCPSGP